LADVGRFRRAARSAARATAEETAAAEIRIIESENRRQQLEHQGELDEAWDQLCKNDPDVVLAALAAAFEDNDADAAPVGVDGHEAYLTVLVPTGSALPERYPTLTPAGNLSLKKLTKRESADLYKLMVCGYVLTTIREAFAVAPGLAHVCVVAVRTGPPDAYGRQHPEAVIAARFGRAKLDGVKWDTVDSNTILFDTADEILVHLVGPNKELATLQTADEPYIADVLRALEVDTSE
jgi:hypothetical protein